MKRPKTILAGLFVVGMAAMLAMTGCDDSTQNSIPAAVPAQPTYTIQGITRDYVTNAYLPGVTVYLYCGYRLSAVSDAYGYWTIPNVPYNATTENFQLQFVRNGYVTYTTDIPVTQDLVRNFNVYLSQLVSVSGTVYAETQPASGATVVLSYNRTMPANQTIGLANPSVDTQYATATTDANGQFTLNNVAADATGRLYVLPFDSDGDGIYEYDATLHDPNFTADVYSGNPANIIIHLQSSAATIDVEWSNVMGSAVIEPNGTIEVVFSRPVVAQNLDFDLWYLPNDSTVDNLTNGAGTDPTGEGTEVPFSVSFDATRTIATITPTVDLDPLSYDADGIGTFWVTVSEVNGLAAGVDNTHLTSAWYQEFRSNTNTPPTIAAPTNLAFDVDEWDGYVIDWDGFVVYEENSNPANTTYEMLEDRVRNLGAGRYPGIYPLSIPLQWDHVTGADEYKIYARQDKGIDVTTWVLVATIDDFVVVNNRVEGKADLSSIAETLQFDAYPSSLGTGYGVSVYGNQIFAEGRSVELSVAAVDIYGNESAMSTSLTLSDNVAPALLDDTIAAPNFPGYDDLTGNNIANVSPDFFGNELRLVLTEPVVVPSGSALQVTTDDPLSTVEAATLQFEGTYSQSIYVRLAPNGAAPTLSADYDTGNPGDLFTNATDQFFIGETVSVRNGADEEVANVTITGIDTTNGFIRCNLNSGDFNLCEVGFTLVGTPAYRSGRDYGNFWDLNAGNIGELDLSFFGPGYTNSLAVGDTLTITYRLTATDVTTVTTTITGFSYNGVINIVEISPGLTGYSSAVSLVREGFKLTVSNLEDTSGNAIDPNYDTVQVDENGNIVVTGN